MPPRSISLENVVGKTPEPTYVTRQINHAIPSIGEMSVLTLNPRKTAVPSPAARPIVNTRVRKHPAPHRRFMARHELTLDQPLFGGGQVPAHVFA